MKEFNSKLGKSLYKTDNEIRKLFGIPKYIDIDKLYIKYNKIVYKKGKGGLAITFANWCKYYKFKLDYEKNNCK